MRRSYGDDRNPDLHPSCSDNEMTLEGEKYLSSLSNNENFFGAEVFLNLVIGDVSSYFHTKDEKEMISNPQNEQERHFYGKHTIEDFWLD